MQRFKKYIDKELKLANVKDSDQLETFGIICTTLPDPPEDFDEFEFTTDYGGQNVVIGVAVQEGKIKRVMFVLADEKEPDVLRPFTEAQLKDFLDQRGEQLVGFFEYITQ
ncbi:MAG: hypothetical protein AB1638_09070, partial [Nitrospirota bacterium]